MDVGYPLTVNQTFEQYHSLLNIVVILLILLVQYGRNDRKGEKEGEKKKKKKDALKCWLHYFGLNHGLRFLTGLCLCIVKHIYLILSGMEYDN